MKPQKKTSGVQPGSVCFSVCFWSPTLLCAPAEEIDVAMN